MICLAAVLILPQIVQAKDDPYGLELTATKAGLSMPQETNALPLMIGRAINYFFGLIGAIALIMILLGGYEWMLSGGNEEKVGKAMKRINSGILGLFIIFVAYALVYGILFALGQASGAN